MAEKKDVLAKLEKLKKMREEIEKRRLGYEAELQEARKDAETFIPKLKADLAEVDGKITALQQEKSGILEQLKELGEKIKVKGAAGKAREGGMKTKFHEMLRSVGVGATITNEDINEYLGSSSGYVGMIIGWEIEAGNIQRIEAGKYKVTGVP